MKEESAIHHRADPYTGTYTTEAEFYNQCVLYQNELADQRGEPITQRKMTFMIIGFIETEEGYSATANIVDPAIRNDKHYDGQAALTELNWGQQCALKATKGIRKHCHDIAKEISEAHNAAGMIGLDLAEIAKIHDTCDSKEEFSEKLKRMVLKEKLGL